MKFHPLPSLRRLARQGRTVAVVAGICFGQAFAATTEIGNAPLFTSSANSVKPNIMFLLDDSGSMAWDYLPDAAAVFDSRMYGKWASQCNGLAYNPDTTYTPPVDATGASLGDAESTYLSADPATQTGNYFRVQPSNDFSKPAVGTQIDFPGLPDYPNLNDGQTVTIYKNATNYVVGKYQVVSGRRKFDVSIVVWSDAGSSWSRSGVRVANGEPVPPHFYTYTGSQPRLGFSYASNGDILSNDFRTECLTLQSTASTKFTKVLVSSLTATQKTNYANWAKYYRDRMITMKSAVSRAFRGVDERYRVGYSTINEKGVSGDNFLDIDDFQSGTGSQKERFYGKFNAALPTGSTPLRAALAKAGRYYAKQFDGQQDPIQYSCQRNFTILSTDGYWNTGGESSSFGPLSLETGASVRDQYTGRTGNYVGQQDGDIPRPMLDGNSMSVTTIDSWTSTTVTTRIDVFPRTSTTTLTLGTVTDTITSRQERTTYSGTKRSVDDGDVNRPGSSCAPNCWVVIDLDDHGFQNGDMVNISGGDERDYRGTFPVERLNRDQFRYKLDFRPGSNGSRDYYIAPAAAASCSVGQRAKVVERQDTGVRRTDTSITRTVVEANVTQKTVVTTFQTHTYTILEENGTVKSRTSADGPVTPRTDVTTDLEPTATSSSTSLSSATSTLGGSWVNVSDDCTWSNGTSSTQTVASPAPSSVALDPVEQVVNSDGSKTTTGPTTVVEVTPRKTERIVSSTGGVGNTLADVAAYYYRTDLRTSALGNCDGAISGVNVCANEVPGKAVDDPYVSFGDAASWQHMTTFTLGMGISGTLAFDPKYQTAKSGTFKQIVDRAANWPNPVSGEPTAVDDLWHAAVNGRGQYFSAGDPSSLTDGLTSALSTIQALDGAASAASTSSLQPVAGDNDIYVAQFRTQDWYGDVVAFTIDETSGAISSTKTWSAQEQLENKLNTGGHTARKIYFPKPDKSGLELFEYDKLTANGLNGLFDGFCDKTGANGGASPSQCPTIGDKTTVNDGESLVNWLRGDPTVTDYRVRSKRLGDIINASPLFVGKPSFRYTENRYQEDFAQPKAGRRAVILAAANDGMLHAFARDTGEELWAYVPSFVMGNMYKLADKGYPDHHQYFVDGSPQMGDIFVDGQWKTIVVGGLNKGGRGYYALDLTDPASPKLMWEFSHDNLGYSFGNPIITKRKNGDWVVVFTSGYNNVSPGDGNGHLFVVNAATGALYEDDVISTYSSGTTPVGTTDTPSGLAKINSWVESELVNTSERFYGGDLLGNLWRFDLDDIVEPHKTAHRLAELKDDADKPQPITTRPVLAAVEHNATSYPVVYVATGRYLGISDLTDKTTHTVYAIKDPLTTTKYGNPRDEAKFIEQTIRDGLDANGNMTRTSAAGVPVDWSSDYGWYADFPVGGERVSVNPQLALNTLFVGSNLPSDSACDVGGDSFLYQFNIATGVATATYVGNVLVQGLTLVQLVTGSATGTVVSIITRSDGSLQSVVGTPTGLSGVLRRTSWRELVD